MWRVWSGDDKIRGRYITRAEVEQELRESGWTQNPADGTWSFYNNNGKRILAIVVDLPDYEDISELPRRESPSIRKIR
jgi:hypothetical protein